MKVKLVSDLHLEFLKNSSQLPNLGSGEILILGGDILCSRHLTKNGELKRIYDEFLKTCSDNFETVFYIAGNHEFYGDQYQNTLKVLKENLFDNFIFMDNGVHEIDNWVFIGSTLWTGFRNADPMIMLSAQLTMNDYHTIRFGDNYRKLSPNDILSIHNESKNYIMDQLNKYENTNKSVWVLTHHGPSNQSICDRYKGMSEMNAFYVNNFDGMIMANPHIKFWSHGHVHSSHNYMIGECNVISNPRGYIHEQNPHFNPNLEVILSN